MTTDLEGRLREALQADAQRARLVNPDRPVAPDGVSAPPSRRARPGRGLMAVAAAIVVVLAAAVVVVGSDDSSRLVTGAPTTTPTSALRNVCPFTANEVSEAIGTTLDGPESLTDCQFGNTFPSVGFEYLDASACTPDGLRSEGYSAPVAGLGVDAYSMNVSLGVSLAVCRRDRPFAVVVDGVRGDALAAAVSLARLALAR